MADDVKKKDSEDSRDGGSVLGVLGRFGEGLVDGLAESRPIIGKPLQYAFETEAYRDQQDRRQANKARLAADKMRAEEFMQNADLRKLQKENAMKDAQEHAASAEDRFDQRVFDRQKRDAAREQLAMQHAQNEEWRKNAPVREAQSDAELARARLAEAAADKQHMQLGVSKIGKNFMKEMEQYPAFADLTFSEQNDVMGSPAIQNLLEAKYYTGEVMAIGQHDPGAYRRMERRLRDLGWTLDDGGEKDDKPGVKYMNMGKMGRLPATKETIDYINRKVSDAALEEINTRSAISDAKTLGNPAMRSIAERTKALMPYTGNSATKSYRVVQEIMDGASEEEKGWHMFHQAISDYRSSGIPTQAKMDGLAACMPFLQKMGYAIEGIDPKNPDVRDATIIDRKGNRRISFDEFADICKKNDSLGARLDKEIGMRQYSYLQKAAGRTVANAEARKMVNPPKAAGVEKGKVKSKNQDDADISEDEAERAQISKDLSATFGVSYEGLPQKKQEKLVTAKKEWDVVRNEILRQKGVNSVSDLSDEELGFLNNAWIKIAGNAGLDAKTFYSPVDSMIRKRNVPKREIETGFAEQRVADMKDYNADYDNNFHGLDDDSGATFRRNHKLSMVTSYRDSLKKRNEEANEEDRRKLKARGR